MCDPVSIAALAAASAGVNAYAQNQTAKAQSKAFDQAAVVQKEEAMAVAEENLGERIKAAREQRSRARVAQGESGLSGQSFALSINQSLQDQNMDSAMATKNLAMQERGIEQGLASNKASIRKVSALEAGLSIASAGVSGYATGGAMQRARQGK